MIYAGIMRTCRALFVRWLLWVTLAFVVVPAMAQYTQMTNLPTVYIDTYNKRSITSKTSYIFSTLTYVDEDGAVTYDSVQIRGRGNSTWGLAKKPYRLRFKESTRFLGKGYAKARSWTLLANHADKSLIRNAVTFDMGQFVGLPYNPASLFVDLVLNGTYLGSYQISDQINVDKKRVNIVEQETRPGPDDDISGGYLMEVDGFGDSPLIYTSKSLYVSLKSPDSEVLTSAQRDYVREFLNDFENRLFDRDTLLICHYDVNFLYVISLYARNNSLQKDAWKKKVRDKFRTQIQGMLSEKYDFYAMQAHPNVDAKTYLKEHFQQTLGKIYTPFSNDEVFSLALDKKDPEGNNEALLAELRKHFFIIENGIGENPEPKLTEIAATEGAQYTIEKKSGLKCLIFNLLGDQYINSDVKLKEDNRFGIAIQSEEGHNVLKLEEGIMSAAYLVITNKKECRVYQLCEKPIFLPGVSCQTMLNTKKDAMVYLVFKIDIQQDEVNRILSDMIDMEKVRVIFGSSHGIKMLDFDSILKAE